MNIKKLFTFCLYLYSYPESLLHLRIVVRFASRRVLCEERTK